MNYAIGEFIDDLRRIVRAEVDESGILARVEPLVRRVVQEPSWLNLSMYDADPVLGYGTTLLHVEPDQSLFVVVDSWLPGRGVPPHDHDTWAVVVGLEGVERNLFWQRSGDANRPEHVELVCIGEQEIRPGEVLLMPTGTIHSVLNETQSTSLSFHVYGRHLNYTARRQFDLHNKRELPLHINPRG